MDETIDSVQSNAIANSVGNFGEKPPNQLDYLVERLSREVPAAVTSPMIYIGATLCLSSLSAGHEPKVPNFRRASIELPFAELAELSEDDFTDLLHEFESLVTSVFTAKSTPVPPDILQRIDPTSKSNILAHETDHLRALPDRARNSARLIMTFACPDYGGEIANDIAGAAIYDTSLIEPRERLQVTLAPEVLSPADVHTARSLLDAIGDPELAARVEADIANRRLIDLSSPM